ncbi:hypothetical protein [Microbacterium allomyrinae]|uniref:Uncharacterized protein n=1 Tax=Microbacterium allomyrinae TaxID=2830666 RepID=A0A9X1S3E7_9MICO|nr:hypothetical protein [Microbacterium allomyrinae]MCC2033104.1 hypothetical protein [Microbacterium allomyrinae]
MPNTQIVPASVNTTAVDMLSSAHGKGEVAHWFLTANPDDRDQQKAIEWIEKSIQDLLKAKDAIVTGQARELRRAVEVTEQITAVEL